MKTQDKLEYVAKRLALVSAKLYTMANDEITYDDDNLWYRMRGYEECLKDLGLPVELKGRSVYVFGEKMPD